MIYDTQDHGVVRIASLVFWLASKLLNTGAQSSGDRRARIVSALWTLFEHGVRCNNLGRILYPRKALYDET
jgi:hypothetical protein